MVESGRTGRRARRGPLRLRTVFLLGVLLPLLGMSFTTGVVVRDRWSDRQASATVEAHADDLGRTAEVRAALANEEAHSIVVSLAATLGVTIEEVTGGDAAGEHAALAESRAQVAAALAAQPIAGLEADLDDLGGLRGALDAGEATYLEVTEVFARIHVRLETRWETQAAQIERAADVRPLAAEPRARLRALRETVAAFAHGVRRVRIAIDLTLGYDASARELLDAGTRFEEASQRATTSLGPRGLEAWEAFRADPASRRTEDLLALAVDVALGDAATLPETELEVLTAALTDGSRWAVLLTETVRATSADLESGAHAQVLGDTRAATIDAIAAATLALTSVAVASLISRQLARPAIDLEAAARRLQRGQFELDPIRARGPRELSATVTAFNDMAATLAALEDHAVALAEDPDAPLLADPLPGRTGRAMQAALDRLRASIAQAEMHRVELHELATRDGLTGLLNRRAAFEVIERDLARTRREGSVLMALYVDLDGLKHFNDTYGHAAGDEAIRRTAEVLAASTRGSDVVARLGGDEFLVAGVVPDGPDGLEEVRAVAGRVHKAITTAQVRLGHLTLPLQASIGVATSGPGMTTVEQLVRGADTALYEAKRAGRHGVVWSRGGPTPIAG